MGYQFASGFDSAGSLAELAVQPRSPGIMYPSRINAISSFAYEDGEAYTEWFFEALTPAEYQALLTTLGLATGTTIAAECTVRTTQNDTGLACERDYANYNAIIVMGRHGRDTRYDGNAYRAEFTLKRLEAL